MPGVGEELRQGKLHRSSDFSQCIERRNSVTVLYSRKVAAQQASALFDITLRHAFLQSVASDGLADIHR